MQSIAQSKEDYMKNNGIAPGPPHMKGIYADPNFSGISYPDGGTPSNTYVPVGWPRKVIPLKDKDPNAAPGAPIQYYPALNNETVEPGFAYEGGGQIEESGRYFYHSDHLGSTGYVTDARGRVSQYVAYMPYGETLFEQHSNSREMPYLFNGKEKDEETGLYYYGARYYDAEMATWMGVDPLTWKYPDLGPYVYCASSPVRYVDVNGLEPGDIIILFTGADFGQGATETTKQMFNNLQKNYNGETIIMYSSSYYLSKDKGIENAYNDIVVNSRLNPEGQVVVYGYSYGGVLATHLANKLNEENISVDLLVTVDAANGWGSGNVNRNISDNVKENDNYYENNTGFWSDPTLSHGDKNTGSKAKVNNYDKSKDTYDGSKIDHMNIDDATAPRVIDRILNIMQRATKESKPPTKE